MAEERELLDLEDGEVDSILDTIEEYSSVGEWKANGKQFWIIWDWNGLKNALRCESYNELNEILDDTLGPDNYGSDEDYAICCGCGDIICLGYDDYYLEDDWVCADCVKEDPEYYLEYLTNDPDRVNTILSADELSEAGLVQLEGGYSYGYYGTRDNPSEILNNLLERYPNGRFIFNQVDTDRAQCDFNVWAFEGYDA